MGEDLSAATANYMKCIRVWINAKATTGNDETFQIRLPRNESIHGLYKILKTTVDVHVAGTGTKQEDGGLWKYQLLSRDLTRVVNKKSVYLETDDDFRTLVRTVKGDAKDTPLAVLTQDKALRSEASQPQVEKASDNFGGNLKQPSEDEVVWDDSNWEEPLDEDGKPYFDPVDDEHFNRVAIKYAEEHKGPIE